jgi:hypothetical protein
MRTIGLHVASAGLPSSDAPVLRNYGRHGSEVDAAMCVAAKSAR